MEACEVTATVERAVDIREVAAAVERVAVTLSIEIEEPSVEESGPSFDANEAFWNGTLSSGVVCDVTMPSVEFPAERMDGDDEVITDIMELTGSETELPQDVSVFAAEVAFSLEEDTEVV